MTKHKLTITMKRAYDKAEESDGTRVLVDRLWPRGLSKERARIDVWLKEVAPSNELRKEFGHDPEKFAEFREKYFAELSSGSGQEALKALRELAQKGPITLIFAARDAEHSNAALLHELLLHGS
jgi:uncharacterized protein YeaO (DUF488 family)